MTCDSYALLRLAFAPAPLLPKLSLAAHHDSQVYSTKDTPHMPSCTASCGPVVSGSLSLPSPGFFSPFPHGTIRYRWHWVFSLGSWSTRIHAGFHVPRATQVPHHGASIHSAYGALTLSGRTFQSVLLCMDLLPAPRVIPVRPYNPGLIRFGLLPVRSPLLGESLLISFPALLRWFTSRSPAPPHYLIHARGMYLAVHGLPHSAVPGSVRVCRSPGPFVACHGLLRPSAPRHPPTGPYPLGHIVALRTSHSPDSPAPS